MSNMTDKTPQILYRVTAGKYKDCLFAKESGHEDENGMWVFVGVLVWHASVTTVTIPIGDLEVYADMSKRRFHDVYMSTPEYHNEWE